MPPKPNLPAEGIALILEYEVGGGVSYYNKFLKYPTVPGGFSTCTIGIGWDFISVRTVDTFLSDWRELPGQSLIRLSPCVGQNHEQALAYLPKIRDILIEWDIAYAVFDQVTITRYYYLAKKTFPGFEELDLRAQAAGTSLIFNRGQSLIGDRRKEMREIRNLIPRKDYKNIAIQIRKMKRLWKNTEIEAGMNNRREAEAKLVEACI